ncbi:hypothetical protein AmDm5_0864 [Acetobacter malorum]|nr:hypothetical protein AmDm5_0864 [Acetobacter malorum]
MINGANFFFLKEKKKEAQYIHLWSQKHLKGHRYILETKHDV